MTFPPEVHFHDGVRLLTYRPKGVLNETSVNKIVSVLGDLESEMKEPFNRFTDTSETDDVELNFKYISRFTVSPTSPI